MEEDDFNWQDLEELDNSLELSEAEEPDTTPQVYAFDDPLEYKPPYELTINFSPNDDYLRRDKQKISIVEMSNIIKRDNHFVIDAFSKELYCYIDHGPNAGIYIEAKQSIYLAVKQIALKYEKEHWAVKSKMDDVYNWINIGLKTLETPELRHINVANGLIYIAPNGKFIHFSDEWTPEYLTTTKLPVYYDPKAECPRWEKFISEIFPEDSKHIAWEIISLLMVPIKNKAASAIMLKGPKNSGKSTFQNGILAFIGEGNYCALAPQNFGERFANGMLKNVLVNVVGDVPPVQLSVTAIAAIKQLIGNDLISGETKFGASYHFRPYARNLFSCNEMPTCASDDAFFDRFLIVPFNNVFSKDPIKEAELNTILRSTEELSGVLNKALEALPKIVKEGIKPTESMKAEHRKVVEENDPLESLKNQCEFGLGYATSCLELHDYYRALEPNDKRRKSNIVFGRDLRKTFPEISRKQIWRNGDRVWCYVGIRLIEKKDEEQMFDDEALGIDLEVEEDSETT
jgi:putative DNA primase/helicase